MLGVSMGHSRYDDDAIRFVGGRWRTRADVTLRREQRSTACCDADDRNGEPPATVALVHQPTVDTQGLDEGPDGVGPCVGRRGVVVRAPSELTEREARSAR